MTAHSLDKFLQAYATLLVFELQQRLGIVKPSARFDDADARFLIQMASLLALGSMTLDEEVEARWKLWAYDVATRLAVARSSDDGRYAASAGVILARLGNFPGREHLRDIYPSLENAARLPAALALEVFTHETDNTLNFQGLGERVLTDFQVKLIGQLRAGHPVSVSAPTSAGKSFALSLDIVDSIASGRAKTIVYVVPTRALIRQVMNDLLERLREAALTDVAVSAAPVVLEDEQMSAGVVYVLTQERFMTLIYSPDGAVEIDRLYVDEAQEIGDNERGMILHSAISSAIRGFPTAQICFASPLTSNPRFLFQEFQTDSQRGNFVERVAPVSQLVVILNEVKGDALAMDVAVQAPTGSQAVGKVKTPFKFRGVKERLAATARFITLEDETTIVYCNGASDAMDIAMELSDALEAKELDPEVKDLQDFVRHQIHASYSLVFTLEKGVAFHYGKMPHLLRGQIEDLLKKRKLKYVVCTSTLLQGINLPAKNILIMKPRKGRGKPMASPDFWNLAGRAGRLRETFNGNIWCISPGEWEENPLKGPTLSEMSSAFRENLRDRDVRDAVIAIIDNPSLIGKTESRVEQLFAKIFTEFTCEHLEVAKSRFVLESDRMHLEQIDEKCKRVLEKLSVPIALCKRNSAISPLSLEDLWGRFRRTSQVKDLLPLDPAQGKVALERMRLIFQMVDQVFSGVYNNSYKYFAALAFWWTSGQSLRDMIANHLGYYKVPAGREQVNVSIRKLLESLEQDLRFRYVKHLKAYVDTLGEYLDVTGRSELKASIAPLHMYVEFGARDKVLLLLMSLGLSRTTSIFIRYAITRDVEIGRRECWQRLLRLPVSALNIPAVCKAEIRRLRGD